MTRILLVDDHALIRRGLRNLLESDLATAQVFEAEDARQATERLMSDSWDLILLDINLPGRSGLEVLEEVRHLHLKTPVIVLSAYPEEEFALRAFHLGASGYLNKQSASEELLVAVKRVLAGGKYVTASMAERLAAALGGDIRPAPHELLSNRELQVMRLVAGGKTLKEIGEALGVSEKTVATYRTRLSTKMGLGSKVDLTRYAVQHGLV